MVQVMPVDRCCGVTRGVVDADANARRKSRLGESGIQDVGGEYDDFSITDHRAIWSVILAANF